MVSGGERLPGRGRLFVISGPSGTGKGTIRDIVMQNHPELRFCVSVTTRRPRPGEIHGVPYIFITEDDFMGKRSRSEFLEDANVYGNFYGTLRSPVEECLIEGCDVLLEKDVQGALAIKASMPEAVLIFIAPPSVGELESRIKKRGTETAADVARRMDSARGELNQARRFDYVVVNYVVEDSVRVLEAIITAERHRVRAGIVALDISF